VQLLKKMDPHHKSSCMFFQEQCWVAMGDLSNTLPTQDCILCKEKQCPPDILGPCSEEEGMWEIQNLEYCGEFEFLESKKGKQK
jgi:hypothetical protein